MRGRGAVEVPSGPTLSGEQLCELWVWICSTVERWIGAPGSPELDEASRMAVALERAVEHVTGKQLTVAERLLRDQGALATARFAHYLLIRRDQWGAQATDEARRRLQVVVDAALLLGALLGLELQDMAAHCQRLEVELGKRSVFQPAEREGVIIESIEEGPTPAPERAAREARAQAAWSARWKAQLERKPRRRQLGEGTP